MPSQRLLIKNGTVAYSNNIQNVDIFILDGKISKIGKDLSEDADKIIDATDKLVLPGGVDSHCHIEQKSASGLVNSDTFLSATSAAALGGNTTVIPFAAQYAGDSLIEVVNNYTWLS